jgi:hypothetical protein
MLEIVTGIIFAMVSYYVTEHDNKDSELYKYLHKRD